MIKIYCLPLFTTRSSNYIIHILLVMFSDIINTGIESKICIVLLAVTWLVLSEIFPATVKGRAIAIATVFNWGTNLIVTFTFLDVMSKLKC